MCFLGPFDAGRRAWRCAFGRPGHFLVPCAVAWEAVRTVGRAVSWLLENERPLAERCPVVLCLFMWLLPHMAATNPSRVPTMTYLCPNLPKHRA